MIGVVIMTFCIFGGIICYVIALQIGYLMGKKKAESDKEDKYWDMCRQIAHYEDELETLKHPFKYGKDFEVEFNNVSFTGSALKDLVGSVGDPWEDGGL